MKNLLTNFRIMAILAVMCGIVSCGQPEPTPEPDKPDNNKKNNACALEEIFDYDWINDNET